MEKIRLQKFLSGQGVASRRKSEELIEQGLVTINGKIAKLGDKVDPENDAIKVGNKLICKPTQETPIYLILNKPAGLEVTHQLIAGRKTVYDLLPKKIENKVWPVGRLDKFSAGLLIFTNDGELTQKLTHPKFEHEKEYFVSYTGELTENKLKKIQHGVKIEGETYKSDKCKVVKPGLLNIVLHEGKNRQIRKILESLGLKVTTLQRIRIGKLLLKGLEVGKFKTISKKDLI